SGRRRHTWLQGDWSSDVCSSDLSLWVSYSFLTGGLAGLPVGGGVRSVGPSVGDDVNSLVSPGYVVFDAALRYDLVNLTRGWKGEIGRASCRERVAMLSVAATRIH